jgi:hypothetical protein
VQYTPAFAKLSKTAIGFRTSSRGSDLERKTIVHRMSDVLLAAKVAFCRPYRCMPQQELNLFEFPATGVTQLRARATFMPHAA